jgi:long-chain acyl-CoA synthetase
VTTAGDGAIGFWSLEHPQNSLAVVASDGFRKSYGELQNDVEKMFAAMPKRTRKKFLMLAARNRYESLVIYLAALRSGHALSIIDATLNRDLLVPLLDTYRPDHVYGLPSDDAPSGYRKNAKGDWEREIKDEHEIHESLALLLNTSGSTGSPKLVRLSLANLQANANSIAEYLRLNPGERAITSLPMSYSYGLSVINSHLLAGASLVLSEQSVLRREFWQEVDTCSCTSFAGVPHTYQMLLQTGLLKRHGASLRTLTQAGGALAESHIGQMHQVAVEHGFRFFVMYGQTEATARISYVPFEALDKKIGSIGVPIPRGAMDVDPETAELIYSGPNVMLGYADCREDLAKGDELHGVLKTGDLARKDADGFFYITGRMKRFLKLFGKRFNLDELEQIVQARCSIPAACLGRDDLLVVAIEGSGENTSAVASMLCSTFGLPRAAVRVWAMDYLPRNARGKVDYSSLADREQESSAPAAVNLVGRTMQA